MPKEIEVKSVLNKTKRRDDWFLDDYTFNPYSSCSFNCLYCYIRGSKYGMNLENSLSVKINAIEVLDRQLANRAKKNQYGVIVLSSATDPYLQIEEKYELTRKALKVILKHRFPVHIITKSDLIERDFDILKEIDQQAILPKDLLELNRGVIVSFSFSSLDDKVARIFEPGATKPSMRLLVLEKSVHHGFLTGVSLMPLLPYITDTKEQLDFMFSTLKNKNIDYILPATITLFGNGNSDSKTLMLNAVKKHYPELLPKYYKFFNNSSNMPKYYSTAFYKKMGELCVDYKLNNTILEAAQKRG
ncbi:SPL family radical SAM protein [Aquimarina mytili]|uniref:Radical SAM protein n=1 Tax=Aquimarina mytili TaxID=874423 RepID=A0A936ZT56_9FLAO|nr:radical SAM protein [Aquimarina mytili]MBL0684947.1 radical SAM protein [Aquimarina mytili]